MEKIVSFSKEIMFDTNIYEISSISLEHNLSLKDVNLISGEFIISGSYKITEASFNIDEFNYNLPFDISIDNKYNTSNVTVDINDFYYEIIDNKILSVNIEVSIDGLEEVENILNIKEDVRDSEFIESSESIVNEEIEPNDLDDSKQIFKQTINEPITSIFDDLDCNENYVTYKVHIVSENDTTESIIQKYETSLTLLKQYNNLSDIKIGDKIIIPTNE